MSFPPLIRLIIHFRIKDRSDESDITAFEDVVTEITGKTTDDFLDLQNHVCFYPMFTSFPTLLTYLLSPIHFFV